MIHCRLLFLFVDSNSLPWNGVHLRSDVGCRHPFRFESLFGRSHRILYLRLQSTRPVGSRLGMGRLFGQHSIRCQILSWICRRRWKRTRHSLHDELAQQRSRPSGKLSFIIRPICYTVETLLFQKRLECANLSRLTTILDQFFLFLKFDRRPRTFEVSWVVKSLSSRWLHDGYLDRERGLRNEEIGLILSFRWYAMKE